MMQQFSIPVRRLLKENVDVIRQKRGIQTRKELAIACRKSESWISKIYKRENGSFRLDDLNTIAEVLGVQVYHLFQPGYAKTMERRTGHDRRIVSERRLGHAGRHFAELRAELNKLPAVAHGSAAAHTAKTDPTQRAIDNAIQRFVREIQILQPGRQTPSDGPSSAPVSKDRRKTRRAVTKPA